MTSPTTLMPVKVFVRLGINDKERMITIPLDDGMDQDALLDAGLAIDGNQAVCGIAPRRDSFKDDDGDWKDEWSYSSSVLRDDPEDWANRPRSLADALNRTQLVLKELLNGMGFAPKFN